MMIQFDLLMGEGSYNVLFNGGMGTSPRRPRPFYEARILAQQARSLMHKGTLPYSDEDPPLRRHVRRRDHGLPRPGAGSSRQLKEYRFMLTHAGRRPRRPSLPRHQIIEYPDADRWRDLSERRIKRYGKAVDLSTATRRPRRSSRSSTSRSRCRSPTRRRWKTS